MWSLTLRDLVFRRRRFLIAILGTALVFGMALVMSGMAAGFRVEAERTLDAIGGEAWIVSEGVAGPFTSIAALPAGLARRVAADPEVARADPVATLRGNVPLDGKLREVNVIGRRAGGYGDPSVVEGRSADASGEAIADTGLGLRLGDRITLQRRTFTIVGLVRGVTYVGGVPVLFIPLGDAQAMAFGGAPLASAIVADAAPSTPPPGTSVLTRADVRADLLRPIEKGIQALDSVQFLLWIVAATIIAAVVYLSALERVRDFAVLKAVGSSTGRLYGSLLLQAVIMALGAAVVASGIALALAPTFALPVVVPARSFALLPLVALVVGALASLSGLRRSIEVDPARAFGSA